MKKNKYILLIIFSICFSGSFLDYAQLKDKQNIKKDSKIYSIIRDIQFDFAKATQDTVTIKKIKKDFIEVVVESAEIPRTTKFHYDYKNIYTERLNEKKPYLAEGQKIVIYHLFNTMICANIIPEEIDIDNDLAHKEKIRTDKNYHINKKYVVITKDMLIKYFDIMRSEKSQTKLSKKAVDWANEFIFNEEFNSRYNSNEKKNFQDFMYSVMQGIFYTEEVNDEFRIYLDFVEVGDEEYNCYSYHQEKENNNYRVNCDRKASKLINYDTYYTFYRKKFHDKDTTYKNAVKKDSDNWIFNKLYSKNDKKFFWYFMFLYINNNKLLEEENCSLEGCKVVSENKKSLKIIKPLYLDEEYWRPKIKKQIESSNK